jgi:hypothetical protein
MTDGIEYRVGTASLPLFPHPHFKEPDAAKEEALLQADEQASVIAIWEIDSITDTITVACLVFQGMIFVPALVEEQ